MDYNVHLLYCIVLGSARVQVFYVSNVKYQGKWKARYLDIVNHFYTSYRDSSTVGDKVSLVVEQVNLWLSQLQCEI